MKNQLYDILQFELSPLAKAGVLIESVQGGSEPDHDIYAPHRDAHYSLLLSTQGHYSLNLDFEEVAVAGPALLVVFPGQVHHLLELREPQGWIITFDPSLLDQNFQLVLEQGIKGPVLLHEQTAFYQQIVALAGLMQRLQADNVNAYAGRATQALLAALLSLLAGQLVTAAADTKVKERRGTFIEQAFRQLLKQHYTTHKQPAWYAAELAISGAHLNDTVKERTGTAVSTHIQQYAILEAKRLLYFTDRSVKEIGYAVGYDEPVYFNKLFKKVTGLTPLRFRQQFRD